MAKDFDLDDIAKETHGYVGADISQLTMEAALQVSGGGRGYLRAERGMREG